MKKTKDRIKSRIKKGDIVQVIAGAHKGQKGRVVEVLREQGRIRVEGVAMQKRHFAPQKNPRYPEGGIIEREGTLHISNVMLFSEELERPVRMGVQLTQDGEKKRVARGRNLKAVNV